MKVLKKVYNNIMRFLFLIALLLTPHMSFAQDCLAKTREVSIQSLSQRPIMLPSNGVVRVATGTEPGEVYDIYKKRGAPFDGLIWHSSTEEYSDTRNFLMKLLVRKEPEPTRYFMTFRLTEEARKAIQGLDMVTVYVTTRVGKTSYNLELSFTQDLSSNCIPH